MNAMCKVIIKKVLQRIFGLWFHEITHICNIYFLNPASLAKQEMLISTMFLAWYGSKNYSRWGVIIFPPIWAFFLIEICRKTLILGPWWFAKSNGYVPFIDYWAMSMHVAWHVIHDQMFRWRYLYWMTVISESKPRHNDEKLTRTCM